MEPLGLAARCTASCNGLPASLSYLAIHEGLNQVFPGLQRKASQTNEKRTYNPWIALFLLVHLAFFHKGPGMDLPKPDSR